MQTFMQTAIPRDLAVMSPIHQAVQFSSRCHHGTIVERMRTIQDSTYVSAISNNIRWTFREELLYSLLHLGLKVSRQWIDYFTPTTEAACISQASLEAVIKNSDAVTAFQMPKLHPIPHRKAVSFQIKGDKHMLVTKTLLVSSVAFSGCADTPHVLSCFPNSCSNKLVCGYVCSSRYFVGVVLPRACARHSSSRFKCFKIAWTTGGTLINSDQVLFYSLEKFICLQLCSRAMTSSKHLGQGERCFVLLPLR